MTGAPHPRYFTLEEARALVPRLRGLVTAAQAEKQMLLTEARALARLAPAARSNGHLPQADRHEARIRELADSIQQKLRQIVETGVEIKDLDLGLLDFPSLREGRVVYLCWRVDEPTVAWWHELDAGFRGRQPLDDSPEG